MRRIFLSFKILFITAVIVLPVCKTFSQNPVISGDSIVIVENTLKKINKNINFTILPGPTYNSSQKLGLMILPVIVYDIDRNDTLTPPSSTAVGVYFDFYGSWIIAARQNFFWSRNRWRATVSVSYGTLELKYYGIGKDTMIISNHDTNYFWTYLKGFYATASCYRKIFSHLYGGFEYNWTRANFESHDSVNNLQLESDGVRTGLYDESLLSPAVIWDSRDNVYWSLKGFYAGINFTYSAKYLLSSYDYGIISMFVSGYHRLAPGNRFSLAWNFNTQNGWGTLPYNRYAVYGRGDYATGYTRGKYVNNAEMVAQAEVRYDIRKFIGVGGYAGTGKVYKNLSTFGPSKWLHFGGVRLYLNVIPSRNLRLRVDFAVARHDYGLYLGVGQGI